MLLMNSGRTPAASNACPSITALLTLDDFTYCAPQLQDVSGGKPVPVEGTALPLWGLEIDPDRAKEDFRAFNARDDGKVTDAPAIPTAVCTLNALSWAQASELRLAFARRFLGSL